MTFSRSKFLRINDKSDELFGTLEHMIISTPKLQFSQSWFRKQKPAPLIFYTIDSLGLVNKKLAKIPFLEDFLWK